MTSSEFPQVCYRCRRLHVRGCGAYPVTVTVCAKCAIPVGTTDSARLTWDDITRLTLGGAR